MKTQQMELILLLIHIKNKKKECKFSKIIYMKNYRFNYLFGLIKFLIFIIVFFLFAIIEFSMRITCLKFILPFLYNLIITIYYSFSLLLLGVYKIPYKYKNHLKNKSPNIIISSQSSLIDWLVLAYNYSPKFLYIAKSKDDKNDAFIEISFFSMLFYGSGIKFPKYSPNNKNKYFDLQNYLNKNKNSQPVVIFPEVTKSNRLAVLPIRSNLMDLIYERAQNKQKNLNIRSEIIINKNYEINTTDSFGIKSLFNLCCNFYTPIEVYSQDIKNENFSEENAEYDSAIYKTFNLYLDSVVQEYLMEPSHRNRVSLNSCEHEKFVEYFKKTNKDSKANYVKKND